MLKKPDILLAHNTEYLGMEAKRKRAANEGVNARVDPEGYRQFVAAKASRVSRTKWTRDENPQ